MDINFEYLQLIPDIIKELERIRSEVVQGATKRWLNVKEVAVYLGYSRDRIYKIKDEYLIEGIHFHNKTGKIIFDKVALDDWVVGKETDEIDQSRRQVVDHILSSVKKISKES